MQAQPNTSDAPGAGANRSPNPSGCRSPRTEHRYARQAAEDWTGLDDGFDHWAILAMLEVDAVAERLSLRSRHVSYLRCVFRKLRPDDFKPGSSAPVVWMTKKKISAHLGIRPRAVSNIENDLARAGFLYWTDTASRRRDGCRDQTTGRIAWAFGINLAPLAANAHTIEATTKAVRQEQVECERLIHEIASIRCHTLIRIKAAVRADATEPTVVEQLLDDARALPTGRSMVGWPLDRLAPLHVEARSIEQRAVAATRAAPFAAGNEFSSENCTLGCTPESGSNTNTNQYQDRNLVAANPNTAHCRQQPVDPAAPQGPERGSCSRGAPWQGTAPPAWLIVESLPRSFAAHLPDGPTPTSTDFLTAANLTRSHLGISPSAWRDACELLSPDAAALAIAVIAARADAGELRSAGGYLRGMIAAARKRQLDLSRSLWGMVDRAAAADPDAATSPAAPPLEPDDPERATEPPGLPPHPDPDEACPGDAAAPVPHAPTLEALEPVIPARIHRRLGPHSRGRRRWLHLMHAAMTECLQSLSVSGPAWRGSMDTLGMHRTTAIGVILAAVAERRPESVDADPQSTFLHLVREEAAAPGSLNRHLQLLRENCTDYPPVRDDAR